MEKIDQSHLFIKRPDTKALSDSWFSTKLILSLIHKANWKENLATDHKSQRALFQALLLLYSICILRQVTLTELAWPQTAALCSGVSPSLVL